MLRIVEYRVRWIVKNGTAKRVVKPIYEDEGAGAGLERAKRGKQDYEKLQNDIIKHG